jgi:hypothetical protein
MAGSIRHRQVEDGVLLSFVGSLSERDALAQAADHLLTLEGITTTLVYGVMDGTIYASARSSDPHLDIGETLRGAFDHLGSAGGHADMAGAQFDLGVFGGVEDDNSLRGVLEASITGPFLEAAEASTRPETSDIYTSDAAMTERYVVTPPPPPEGDESTTAGCSSLRPFLAVATDQSAVSVPEVCRCRPAVLAGPSRWRDPRCCRPSFVRECRSAPRCRLVSLGVFVGRIVDRLVAEVVE